MTVYVLEMKGSTYVQAKWVIPDGYRFGFTLDKVQESGENSL